MFVFLFDSVFNHEIVSYRSQCKDALKWVLSAVRFAYVFFIRIAFSIRILMIYSLQPMPVIAFILLNSDARLMPISPSRRV